MSFYDLSNEYDRGLATKYLDKLIELGETAELRKKPVKRSNKLNSYFHVCISLLSIDSGYTIDEQKEVTKKAIGFTYEKNGEIFPRQTRDLNSAAMSSVIENVRKLAATQGVDILSPEEYEKIQAGVDAYCYRNRV